MTAAKKLQGKVTVITGISISTYMPEEVLMDGHSAIGRPNHVRPEAMLDT
jgi:hypothetical protein